MANIDSMSSDDNKGTIAVISSSTEEVVWPRLAGGAKIELKLERGNKLKITTSGTLVDCSVRTDGIWLLNVSPATNSAPTILKK